MEACVDPCPPPPALGVTVAGFVPRPREGEGRRQAEPQSSTHAAAHVAARPPAFQARRSAPHDAARTPSRGPAGAASRGARSPRSSTPRVSPTADDVGAWAATAAARDALPGDAPARPAAAGPAAGDDATPRQHDDGHGRGWDATGATRDADGTWARRPLVPSPNAPRHGHGAAEAPADVGREVQPFFSMGHVRRQLELAVGACREDSTGVLG